MEYSCLINIFPAAGQQFSRLKDWKMPTIPQLKEYCCVTVVKPAEFHSYLSFKYCFSMVKCVFHATQTEDVGDACAGGSTRRVMMLLTHCQLGANQSINQSIVIYWAPKDRKSPRNTQINYFVPQPQAHVQVPPLIPHTTRTHSHSHQHIFSHKKPKFWTRSSALSCAQSFDPSDSTSLGTGQIRS